MNMILTASDFYTTFPELEALDAIAIEAMLIRILISQNSYEGICDPERQKMAVLLHTAHCLVRTNTTDGIDLTRTQNIKKIENKNDTLEFQANTSNPYDLDSTPYGLQLLDLIESNSCNLFLHTPQGLPRQLLL
jgi:hypothetical protein